MDSMMAESTLTFENLPNEIILAIVARVPYSKEDFGTLLLVSHRVHDLMVSRGRLLIRDIAAVQYPEAFNAFKYPPHPFPEQLRFRDLRLFQRTTCDIDSAVKEVSSVRCQAVCNGCIMGNFLGCERFEADLRLGLFLYSRIAARVEDPLIHCTYGEYPRLQHLFVQSLPPLYAIAMRNTSLIFLDLLKLVDTDLMAQRRDTKRPPTKSNLFSKSVMKATIESRLYKSTPGSSICDSIFRPFRQIVCPGGPELDDRHVLHYDAEAWELEIKGATMSQIDPLLSIARPIPHLGRRLRRILDDVQELEVIRRSNILKGFILPGEKGDRVQRVIERLLEDFPDHIIQDGRDP
jgi:hypothetical protein